MIAIAVILFIGAAYHTLGALGAMVVFTKRSSIWDSNIYLSLAGVEVVAGIGFLLV